MKIDKKTSDMLRKEYLKRVKNIGFVNNRAGSLMSALDASIERVNMKFKIEEDLNKKGIEIEQQVIENENESENNRVIRRCKTCGKEFETYKYWRMANCPEHRQVQWKDISLDSD